jgi:hypothetical protein
MNPSMQNCKNVILSLSSKFSFVWCTGLDTLFFIKTQLSVSIVNRNIETIHSRLGQSILKYKLAFE